MTLARGMRRLDAALSNAPCTYNDAAENLECDGKPSHSMYYTRGSPAISLLLGLVNLSFLYII
ncbi:MAG: hypothetical protein IJQ39_05880 [Thermoguttaceae bacterium]|nr:hypothetical protein [Thermoguttaceae bacterium]